jgi:hypothetical protein
VLVLPVVKAGKVSKTDQIDISTQCFWFSFLSEKIQSLTKSETVLLQDKSTHSREYGLLKRVSYHLGFWIASYGHTFMDYS